MAEVKSGNSVIWDRLYIAVSLSHNGRTKTYGVHRLVCAAFHGPTPSPTHEVRHLNGNPQDNRPDNLAWGTRIENWADRIAHGHGTDGQRNPMAKLSDKHREHIRFAVEVGLCSQRHVARVMGLSHSTIVEVCRSGALIQANHAGD